MRVIVWQWGRHGAGPRFAVSLAEGFQALDGVEVALSLSTAAEVLRGPNGATCELPVHTYSGLGSLAWQIVRAPLTFIELGQRLRRFRPQVAVCAMPGPLDLLMVLALRRFGTAIAVIAHDAEAHPGDRFPLLFTLQRVLLRRADLVIALSNHVAAELQAGGSVGAHGTVLVASHPPFAFGPAVPPVAHAGPRRVLCFGRLRTYKGLDLLADALRLLGPRPDMEVRIVGHGPESAALTTLRSIPGVRVENRWVPEAEVNAILGWADVVVLPYREASQSGIAPTALASGRRVVATRVGGLPEQLKAETLATLCEPDAQSLAAALRDVLEAPEAAAAGANEPRAAWRVFAANLLERLEPLSPVKRPRYRPVPV